MEVASGRAQAGAARCPHHRRGLIFYRLRYADWHELRGVKVKLNLSIPRGCAHTLWRAKLWKARAAEAREEYLRWTQEQRRFRLRDFEVAPGKRAWQRAVREVQRAYPGTEPWLLSCSASEGGWGRWVPNSQGSGANGWLQFMEGTFWRMFGAAHADVSKRGFKVPRSAASWYSPLGQALAGAWGVTNGRRHEWVGRGC